jgi:hypothetical protein
MNNNEKLHISLRGCVKFNNKNLDKLNDTERKALEKLLNMLESYNKDITYKSLMIYVDEPLLLYNKLKEYYID